METSDSVLQETKPRPAPLAMLSAQRKARSKRASLQRLEQGKTFDLSLNC